MKKTLLGPCDSLQLEPFHYPWAWDMSRQCEQNTWTPEEIPVADDVAAYKDERLGAAHKHMFESVMAQLTTFDILRGDDAAETFLALLAPAEIKHFLKRLVWEEAVHTRSYRYIIENLGIPLEIYDRWRTVPSMKARVDLCTDLSDPLRYIVADMYLNPEFTWSTSYKQCLLKAMIFWFLLFEGVWFWMSLLGPLQNLSRLGVFKGAAEQFQYIARDEAQHIQFGINLINKFIAENPAAWDKGLKDDIVLLCYKTLELEKEFYKYCLGKGGILGYSLPAHLETTQHFINLRMLSIGIPRPYPNAQHCFPWMSEMLELKKEKNFFEQRVTEYQTGGSLQWED